MLLRRNAKCYEEKSYHYQIYDCLKVKPSFHKKLFQKEKNKVLLWIYVRHFSSILWFNGRWKLPVASLNWNSWIKGQISAPLWTHMGHKGWIKDGKSFVRCYTFASQFWDEFNANFVLLYFSNYSSIKMWHLYLKNVEKNKALHLRLVLFYLL